jgi:hypothetical protein
LGRGGYRVGFGTCPHPLPVSSWTQHQVVLACVLHHVVKRCYPDAWLWHPRAIGPISARTSAPTD